MAGSELEGLSILIVEDELLVAMDIADAFENVGLSQRLLARSTKLAF